MQLEKFGTTWWPDQRVKVGRREFETGAESNYSPMDDSKMSQAVIGSPKQLANLSRTKTVVTVGPASSSKEMLSKLLQAGASVFRLNMAHGERSGHEEVIRNIRAAAEETGICCGILVDLAGPKIRMGQLVEDPLQIENGQQVSFIRGETSNSPTELTSQYEPMIDEVKVGDSIILADGLAKLKVVDRSADRLECVVVDGGKIRSRQGINLPATNLSVPALGQVDIDNAIWAAGQQVDFVSLSFVREASEIMKLTEILRANGSEALTISKIEKREALENLDEIVEASGGIMVARGDLGVEVDIWKTPLAQKQIIRTCLSHRKPVIVATQMLESMHTSKLPTRAEVSDVANAILDGADACMLSGETAIGDYPVEAVSMMQKIMCETEEMFRGRASKLGSQSATTGWAVSDAVVYGAAQIARRVEAKLMVLASDNATTALVKSKQRDYIQTVCLCDNFAALNRMTLFWGIIPVYVDSVMQGDSIRRFIDDWATQAVGISAGEAVVLVTDTELLPGVHDNVMVMRVKSGG